MTGLAVLATETIQGKGPAGLAVLAGIIVAVCAWLWTGGGRGGGGGRR